MTTLAADKARQYGQGDIEEIPVIASDIIYEGAAVGDDGNGRARPLVAGDIFYGFAELKADNAAGGAGAIRVRVRTKGKIKLAVASAALGDLGKPVYASDDDTFTLTPGTNSHIGRISQFIATGVVVVEFDAGRGGAGEVSLLIAATGTPSDTIADVGGAFNQTTLNNNFKSLADKINALAAQNR